MFADIRPYLIFTDELNRLVTPGPVRAEILHQLHSTHTGTNACLRTPEKPSFGQVSQRTSSDWSVHVRPATDIRSRRKRNYWCHTSHPPARGKRSALICLHSLTASTSWPLSVRILRNRPPAVKDRDRHHLLLKGRYPCLIEGMCLEPGNRIKLIDIAISNWVVLIWRNPACRGDYAKAGIPHTSDWTVNKTCVPQTYACMLAICWWSPLISAGGDNAGHCGALHRLCPLMTPDTFESEWACGKEEEWTVWFCYERYSGVYGNGSLI